MKYVDLSSTLTTEEYRAWRDAVRERAKIQIPCTNYLQKARNGGYICPSCKSGTGDDGTGAVKYYPETNTYHCHKCHKGGNSLDMIQIHYGCIDYNATLEKAAELIHLTREDYGKELEALNKRRTYPKPQGPAEAPQTAETVAADNLTADKEKRQQAANNEVTDFTAYYTACRKALKEGGPGAEYLAGRGISEVTAKKCFIGFDAHFVHPRKIRERPELANWRPDNPGIVGPCDKHSFVFRALRDDSKTKKCSATGGDYVKTGIFNYKAINNAEPFQKVVYVCEGFFNAMSVMEAGADALALNGAGNVHKLITFLKARPKSMAVGPVVFGLLLDNDERGKQAKQDLKELLPMNGFKWFDASDLIQAGCNDVNESLIKDRAAFIAGVNNMTEHAEELAAQDAQKEAAAQEERGQQEAQEEAEEAERQAAGPAADVLDFLERIQTRMYEPHPTGTAFIDKMLKGGLVRGQCVLLMAAPGAGKTTLSQMMCEGMAENGTPCIYVNMEMSKDQMLAKAISGRVYKHRRIKKGALEIMQGYAWTDEEREAITTEIKDYAATIRPNMEYITTTTDLNEIIEMLEYKAAAAVREERPTPFVVIDYLHLLTCSAERLDAQGIIKKALAEFKSFAMKYNTNCILITAVNRESVKNGRITLESGRDSSATEYTGDYVLSLNYWLLDQGIIKNSDQDELAEIQSQDARHMIIRVLKSRFGNLGRFAKCYFYPEQNMFYGEHDFILTPNVDINNLTLPETPESFAGVAKRWRERMQAQRNGGGAAATEPKQEPAAEQKKAGNRR